MLAGLEPDGIFGSGVVEIWQKLQPRMRAKAAKREGMGSPV
jgi:hypothetical protein